MNTQAVKKSGRRTAAWGLPFDAINYIWLTAGILLIAAGYYFLSQGPALGFQSRTLAPILLVMGYCIFIPIGLMAKKAAKKS